MSKLTKNEKVVMEVIKSNSPEHKGLYYGELKNLISMKNLGGVVDKLNKKEAVSIYNFLGKVTICAK
jgi:hypothetical protein